LFFCEDNTLSLSLSLPNDLLFVDDEDEKLVYVLLVLVLPLLKGLLFPLVKVSKSDKDWKVRKGQMQLLLLLLFLPSLSALDKHDDAILIVVPLRINNAITTRLVIIATLLSSTNTKS
jgi:hypothetical protein